jgi:hypothetical protein
MINLYNDYEQAINIWDASNKIPMMPPVTTKVTRTGFIMPFIIFGTERNGVVNLTYDIKLLQPDNTFSPKDEYNDITIAKRRVNGRTFYRADSLGACYFPGSAYKVGKYHFHISIKENEKVICICIVEFELVEE